MVSLRITLCSALLVCTGLSAAQGLPDPTRPQVSVGQGQENGLDAEGFPRVTVSAVFVREHSRSAVLNGEQVQQGQKWRGLLVREVRAEGVVLESEHGRKTFSINDNSFLKDTKNEF